MSNKQFFFWAYIRESQRSWWSKAHARILWHAAFIFVFYRVVYALRLVEFKLWETHEKRISIVKTRGEMKKIYGLWHDRSQSRHEVTYCPDARDINKIYIQSCLDSWAHLSGVVWTVSGSWILESEDRESRRWRESNKIVSMRDTL